MSTNETNNTVTGNTTVAGNPSQHQGANAGNTTAGAAPGRHGTGEKIKGAYQVLHGMGENIRGTGLGAMDIKHKRDAVNEEIARKGRLETEEGLAKLRGTKGTTQGPVHGDNFTMQGGVAPMGPAHDANTTAPVGHHRDDAVTDLNADPGKVDHGVGQGATFTHQTAPSYNRNDDFNTTGNQGLQTEKDRFGEQPTSSFGRNEGLSNTGPGYGQQENFSGQGSGIGGPTGGANQGMVAGVGDQRGAYSSEGVPHQGYGTGTAAINDHGDHRYETDQRDAALAGREDNFAGQGTSAGTTTNAGGWQTGGVPQSVGHQGYGTSTGATNNSGGYEGGRNDGGFGRDEKLGGHSLGPPNTGAGATFDTSGQGGVYDSQDAARRGYSTNPAASTGPGNLGYEGSHPNNNIPAVGRGEPIPGRQNEPQAGQYTSTNPHNPFVGSHDRKDGGNF